MIEVVAPAIVHVCSIPKTSNSRQRPLRGATTRPVFCGEEEAHPLRVAESRLPDGALTARSQYDRFESARLQVAAGSNVAARAAIVAFFEMP